MRALIVDDDVDHADSICDVLTARGIACDVAGSGESGLERFRRGDYDIVFMDLKLPGMNGIEAFHELRRLKPDIKVMFMTGFGLDDVVTQALAKGALGVLRKPFETVDLLRVVEPGP